MSSIILAFPARAGTFSQKLRDTLVSFGFEDITSTTNASAALTEIHLRESGVLIAPIRLPDMYYREILDYLPGSFRLLLLDTAFNICSLREPDIVSLATPVKARDLISTVRMLAMEAEQTLRKQNRKKKKIRSEEEQRVIDEAKHLLMERNHMSEPEAYRYLQKTSMDADRTLPETARMVLLLDSGA